MESVNSLTVYEVPEYLELGLYFDRESLSFSELRSIDPLDEARKMIRGIEDDIYEKEGVLYFSPETKSFSELRSIDPLLEAENMVEGIESDFQYQLTKVAEKYIKKFKKSTKCYIDHCDISLPEIIVFDRYMGPIKLVEVKGILDEVNPYDTRDNDEKRITSVLDGCSPEDPFIIRYKPNDNSIVSYYFEVPNKRARGDLTPCSIRVRCYDKTMRPGCLYEMLSAMSKGFTPIIEKVFDKYKYL